MSIVRSFRTWAAALVAITATATMQANADTFFVNGSCGNDAWTGTSSVCSAPDGPKRTIQHRREWCDARFLTKGFYAPPIAGEGYSM